MTRQKQTERERKIEKSELLPRRFLSAIGTSLRENINKLRSMWRLNDVVVVKLELKEVMYERI